MKKIFTLFAAVMMAAGAYADEVVLWENITDGQELAIADIEAAGGADADIVTFYLEDVEGGHDGWGMGGFGPSSGWGTDYAFTGNGNAWTQEITVGEIKTIAGSESGIRVRLYNGATLPKVTLQPSISYGDAQTINVTDGFIPASEFAGLSDAAIVEFTYNVAGELGTYANWGIGRIGSNDDTGEGPSYQVAVFPASAIGDIVYKCKFADIKKALDVTPDGIVVQFWGFGDGQVTASLVKVEAFDVVTGINAVRSEVENENAPIYNLAGQRVDKSYKGVVNRELYIINYR